MTGGRERRPIESRRDDGRRFRDMLFRDTMLRSLTRLALVAVVLYALACGAWFVVFAQPPEVWSLVVGKTPNWLRAITPMRSIMLYARRGALEVSDAAPDFQLQTRDHSSSVRLSDFQGDRPVVLVFGSYT